MTPRSARNRRRRLVLSPVSALVAAVGSALLVAATLAVPAAAAPPTPAWKVGILAPTVPGQAHAQFTAVSCPSGSSCMAVGTEIAPDGTYQPLAETWNGHVWRVVPSPGRGSAANGLTTVSCVTSSFCAATASGASRGHLLLWNGHTWRLSALPDTNAVVSDVQCRAAANCMAVGRVNQQATTWHRTGTGWHRIAVPSPYRSRLAALSCPSATVCYAGGTTALKEPFLTRPLVLRWNGKTWGSTGISRPYGSVDHLSCPTTTRCTAVGTQHQYDGDAMLADLTGTTWRYPSLGSGTYEALDAVSCTVGGTCTMLGTLSDQSGDGTVSTIVVRSGKGPFHRAKASYPDLEGLTCSAQACVVVGSTLIIDRSGFSIADNPTSAVAYTGLGTSLRRAAVPQPPSGSALALTAVSCAGGGFCAAVASSDSAALYMRATPAKPWARVGGVSGELADVWCTSDTFCMAVARGRSVSWNGSTWTTHPIPTPNGAGKDVVTGVTCVSATWCDAVGTTGDEGNPVTVFIVHWNGSTWTTVPAPNPAGNTGWVLSAISCTATNACLAVGNGFGTDSETPLAERWNGTAWTVVGHSGLSAKTGLADVSCWSATGCMVSSPGDYGDPVVASWDGSTFTPRPINDVQEPTANAVSCRSAQSCTAVGLQRVGNTYAQLGERWNGSTWAQIPTGSVSGDQPELYDVSCRSDDGLCTAVGSVDRAYSVALVVTGG